MSQSKKEKERKTRTQAFKEKAKEQAKQQNIPKTYLVPLTEWQSTDILDLRGDLLEAMEQQFVLTYQELQNAKGYLDNAQKEFQRAAHIMQMIMQTNIKAGKVRLKYSWNNGEDATDDDVKEYEAKMEEIRKTQQKQFEEAQAKLNAEKTGLVAPDGSPIGTTQDLSDSPNLTEDGPEEVEENQRINNLSPEEARKESLQIDAEVNKKLAEKEKLAN